MPVDDFEQDPALFEQPVPVFIVPSDDPAGMPVRRFEGPWRFLSNFWPCEVEGPEDHLTYPSAEHAFQAAKSADLRDRMAIRRLPNAGEAKRAGQQLTLREDWEDVKREVMLHIVLAKFKDNPGLLDQLRETGDRELTEGNTWGDDYWGMILHPDGSWHGRNILGKILMAVRTVLA